MKFVEKFGREKDAWLSKTERWDGKAVTVTTKTQLSTGDVSEHKITVYKKLVHAGEMKGNKCRKIS
jgi:hypothetical protein